MSIRSLRTLRALRPLRAISRFERMRVSYFMFVVLFAVRKSSNKKRFTPLHAAFSCRAQARQRNLFQGANVFHDISLLFFRETFLGTRTY